jgi:ribose 5-phosphate isomerase B
MNATSAVGPRVALSCDHAGVDLRDELSTFLTALGYEVVDLGPQSTVSVDYPAYGRALASSVASQQADWGVLLCGTGIGMSIAANRVAGARAALVHDPFTAQMAREHNDANILVLGARVLSVDQMKALIDLFRTTSFTPGDDGRHLRRVQAIDAG